MFKGATLFALVFVFIAPQARTFLGGVFTRTVENLDAWAPVSYIAVMLLLAAPLVSVLLVKNWPQRVEPESPMARYRRDVPFED